MVSLGGEVLGFLSGLGVTSVFSVVAKKSAGPTVRVSGTKSLSLNSPRLSANEFPFEASAIETSAGPRSFDVWWPFIVAIPEADASVCAVGPRPFSEVLEFCEMS